MSVLATPCQERWPHKSDKESLPGEVDASTFDVGFLALVVQTRAFKCFGWDGNYVFLSCISEFVLWLDCIFPFIFHDISDAVLAQLVPLAT